VLVEVPEPAAAPADVSRFAKSPLPLPFKLQAVSEKIKVKAKSLLIITTIFSP
jgi:hypothetical protein